MRSGVLIAALSVAAVSVSASATQLPSIGWDGDFFAAGVIGDWEGHGTVYGNPVTLSRDWSFDLAGHFLRATMAVRMSNGEEFRALGYWSRTGENGYRIYWMDAQGVQRNLVAVGDPDDSTVTTTYFDSTTDEYPGFRKLIFRIEGPGRYVEEMEVRTDDGWERIAEFVFTRVAE